MGRTNWVTWPGPCTTQMGWLETDKRRNKKGRLDKSSQICDENTTWQIRSQFIGGQTVTNSVAIVVSWQNIHHNFCIFRHKINCKILTKNPSLICYSNSLSQVVTQKLSQIHQKSLTKYIFRHKLYHKPN